MKIFWLFIKTQNSRRIFDRGKENSTQIWPQVERKQWRGFNKVRGVFTEKKRIRVKSWVWKKKSIG